MAAEMKIFSGYIMAGIYNVETDMYGKAPETPEEEGQIPFMNLYEALLQVSKQRDELLF